MNYGKQGLKVLGVSLLAALGLMAFGAGGAQASGSFLVEGLSAPWTATISGEGENLLASRFWVLGLNFEISCHQMTLAGTIKNNGHGHATLNFNKCLANGTNSDGTLKGSVCECEDPIVLKLLILVILHNSKPYLLFTPLDGLTAGSYSGEPCIPGASVKGSFVASISNPDGDDVVKLISTKGMLSLFTSDKLFYGINEMHLDIDASVELLGSHLGRRWGAA